VGKVVGVDEGEEVEGAGVGANEEGACVEAVAVGDVLVGEH